MVNIPSVSVVMPIYNAMPYLTQALDSLLSQTLHNIEIVCVNDGSKDNSLEVMRDYAQRDDRIKIIDKPNGGYGHSMNVGIAACTGEYVGILEPDDYLKPTMYEKLYACAKENDLDFVRSDYYRLTTDESGVDHLEREPICFKSEYYNTLLNPQDNLDVFNIRMENWTGIYRRSWLEEHDIRFNESPGAGFQDNGFWFQSYCWATRIMVLEEAFYCYRNDNAASSINQTDKVFVMLDEYRWIDSWLHSRPELCSKFVGILNYKKTHNCEFAFSRLARDFRLPFMERYAEEYRNAYEAGEIDESLFPQAELQRLKEIMRDPADYVNHLNGAEEREERLRTAKNKGNVALFREYVKEDGLLPTLKRVGRFLSK